MEGGLPDGDWDCTIITPMGPHRGLLTVERQDALSFAGSISGDMGTLPITDGRIAGNTLSWQMKLTAPLPITLDCTALIEGDALSGQVSAGMFGTMTITGARRG